jgi:hypothetical protein
VEEEEEEESLWMKCNTKTTIYIEPTNALW